MTKIVRLDGSEIELPSLPGAEDYFRLPGEWFVKRSTQWIARITGPDPRYGVAREFLPREKLGRREGYNVSSLQEGALYEIARRKDGRYTVRVFGIWDPAEKLFREIPEEEANRRLLQMKEDAAKPAEKPAEKPGAENNELVELIAKLDDEELKGLFELVVAEIQRRDGRRR